MLICQDGERNFSNQEGKIKWKSKAELWQKELDMLSAWYLKIQSTGEARYSDSMIRGKRGRETGI